MKRILFSKFISGYFYKVALLSSLTTLGAFTVGSVQANGILDCDAFFEGADRTTPINLDSIFYHSIDKLVQNSEEVDFFQLAYCFTSSFKNSDVLVYNTDGQIFEGLVYKFRVLRPIRKVKFFDITTWLGAPGASLHWSGAMTESGVWVV